MNNKEKLVDLFGAEKGEKIAAAARIRIKVESLLGDDLDDYFQKVAEHNGYSLENCKVASAINESETYKQMVPVFGEEDAEFICESIRKVARFKAAGVRRDEDYLGAIEGELDAEIAAKSEKAGE